MKSFETLLALAAMLSRVEGATVPEIREKLDYASRSSIHLDYENIFKHFSLAVFKNQDERRGREVVYIKLCKKDANAFMPGIKEDTGRKYSTLYWEL